MEGGIAMLRYKLLTLLCAAYFVMTSGSLQAQDNCQPAVHIDIPTELEKMS